MVRVRREHSSMRFRGTIIDLESTGGFDRAYPPWDPRQCASISPTIFGYMTDETLVQHCAEGEEQIQEIIEIMKDALPRLEEQFYAFNCSFERCIITNTCGQIHTFLDVRERKYRGSKWAIRQHLGTPTYDDPFHGDGLRCMHEWHRGNYDDCLRHNRACLLIERDIQEHARGIRV
jgi:hypothetical protein